MKWKKYFHTSGKRELKNQESRNSVPKSKEWESFRLSIIIIILYIFNLLFHFCLFSVCFFHFHLILQEFFFVLFCFVPLCLCCVGRILCVYVCFRQNFFYEIFFFFMKNNINSFGEKKRMASKKERKTKNKHQHCVNEKERKKNGRVKVTKWDFLFCFVSTFSLSLTTFRLFFYLIFIQKIISSSRFFFGLGCRFPFVQSYTICLWCL